MSKVFSAKSQTVEFEYELMDGEKVSLVARSLSSKEQESMTNSMSEKPSEVVQHFKDLVSKQLDKNDAKIVKAIVKEQYEHSDIVTFSNEIGKMIQEAKLKK